MILRLRIVRRGRLLMRGGGWWRPLAHDVLYNQVDALFVYCAEQVALIGEDHMAAPYSH